MRRADGLQAVGLPCGIQTLVGGEIGREEEVGSGWRKEAPVDPDPDRPEQGGIRKVLSSRGIEEGDPGTMLHQ
jgi:hypothetical protein